MPRAALKRFMGEPDDSVVVFMIKGNNVFPVVFPKGARNSALEQASAFAKLSGCTFSGRLMSVGQWNREIAQGIDPVQNVVDDLFSDTTTTA